MFSEASRCLVINRPSTFVPSAATSGETGITMNAHIRTHLSLAGVCGHCLQATMATQEHAVQEALGEGLHGLPRTSESTGKTSSGSKKKASTKSGRR